MHVFLDNCIFFVHLFYICKKSIYLLLHFLDFQHKFPYFISNRWLNLRPIQPMVSSLFRESLWMTLLCSVEAPIIDFMRDFASNMENCKVVQFFMCRKIEIIRISIFLVISFLKLKILWNFEPKVGSNTLPMFRVCHNHSFWDEFLLTLAFKTGDICHGNVDSLVVL